MKKSRTFVTVLPLVIACMIFAAIIINSSNAAKSKSFIVHSYDLKKDTVPELKYSVTFSVQEWTYIDSVMRESNYWIGRNMPFEQADQIKANFFAIITEFSNQIRSQLKQVPIANKKDSTGKKKN